MVRKKNLSTAWMFPGQGSQRPAMAAGIAACRELFDEAAPGLAHLKAMCTTESKPVWSPEVLQPALFITCTGAARSISAKGLHPGAVVGHSLGEYSALVAAGALEFKAGLELVSIRGKAMAAAARARPGGMAAVMGLEEATIKEICDEIADVWVANLNSPSQTVISGKDASLARAAEQALKAGATRVIRLDVPIGGHSPLMEPAAEKVSAALDRIQLTKPNCLFYSVADAAPHSDPVEIAELLVAAITSPVRFSETVWRMQQDGVREFLEVGPGRVLRGLVRQISPEATLGAVANDQDAESLAGSRSEAGTTNANEAMRAREQYA